MSFTSIGFCLFVVTAAAGCGRLGLGVPPDHQCQGAVACAIYCEHGYALDNKGCPTCTCNPPPACPEIACFRACEYGSRKDANGCETCDCLPPPSRFCPGEEPCDLDCPDGFKRAPSGCLVCACERVAVGGQCIRNSNDRCTTDADCVAGGCGGELCYNPNLSSGISTCDCKAPQYGCGCVNGLCSHYR